MEQRNNDNGIWASQYARLGSFLVASSFLVAAFIQLVTSPNDSSKVLTYAVALLGSLIAELYFLMNSWHILPKCITGVEPNQEHVHHTWFIPLLFLAFWLAAWISATDFYWSILLVVVLVIPYYVYQKCRK